MCIARLSDFADTAASPMLTEPVSFVGILRLMRLDFYFIQSARAVVGLHLFNVLTDPLNQQAGDPPWP